MKKLAAVVVVVTVTSEQMGWWRRFGRFWSRAVEVVVAEKAVEKEVEEADREKNWKKKLIFLPNFGLRFHDLTAWNPLLSIGGGRRGWKRGILSLLESNLGPLIRPERISIVDLKWSSWTVNITAKMLVGLATLRRRRSYYDVNQ